ncbi:unnamed protein product [Malus baccata var. baccata]
MSANESMEFKDTELTLGLPVFNFKISSSSSSCSMKRGFMETVDQICLQKSSTCSGPRGSSLSSSSSTTTPAVIKAPAANSRKNVKVSADGAPYLRKLDLEEYKSYQQLLTALDQMFTSLTICRKCIEDSNEVMKPALKGMDQYVLTYEDKYGEWMLVGDVPWKMFIESCKRIRLMKSADAVGIAPRTQIPS